MSRTKGPDEGFHSRVGMDFENAVHTLAYVSSVERSDRTEYSGLASAVLAKYDAV
jgi:hypothetical protein